MIGLNMEWWRPTQDDNLFAKIGKNVRIHPSCVIPNLGSIELGDNVRIDAFCVLTARKISIGSNAVLHSGCTLTGAGAVTIGEYCGISHGCRFFTSTDDVNRADHSFAEDNRIIVGDIVLERHATLCANTVVLPNVRLGYGSYIGAFSLVRQDMPRLSLCAGVPARVLKIRKLTEEDFAEFERCCEERNADTDSKT